MFALVEANSFFLRESTTIEKGDTIKNSRVAFPESVHIHLKSEEEEIGELRYLFQNFKIVIGRL